MHVTLSAAPTLAILHRRIVHCANSAMALPHSILIAERARLIATRVSTWLPLAVLVMLKMQDFSRRKFLIALGVPIVCWLVTGVIWIHAFRRWRLAKTLPEQLHVPCERCDYLLAPQHEACPECGAKVDYQGLSIKWSEARSQLSSGKRFDETFGHIFMFLASVIVALVWIRTMLDQGPPPGWGPRLLLLMVGAPPMFAFMRAVFTRGARRSSLG